MAENAQRQVIGPIVQDGVVHGGAQLYHYAAGLNANKDIYDDRGKEIPLPQPIRADANGMFTFFGDGLYKFVIVDAESQSPNTGVIHTWDNFSIVDGTDTAIEKGDAVNSASTTPIGPGYWMHILGSNPIAAFSGTLPFFWAVFDGNPILTHSSNLNLPGNRNRSMKTGDVGFFLNEGAGGWRMAAHMESEGGYQGRNGSSYPATATLAVPQDGDFADIGGADLDITAIASMVAGYHFIARFTGSGIQLIHSAALSCPNGDDYRLLTNEIVEFRSLGDGNWFVGYRSGPTLSPGDFKSGLASSAADGYVLPVGTALVASRYRALAKQCIPLAATLGTTGTSLGTGTFDNATDTWTKNAHGLINGDIVQLTNSGGNLPTGFSASTVYYVVNATADTFKLSTTRGGSAVNGTTNGTGTHTVHNKFQVPDVRGRVFAALDNLGGVAASRLTAATGVGVTTGVEQVVLSLDQIPGDNFHAASSTGGGKHALTDSPGGANPHNNVQPTMAVGVQIRW